MVRNSKDRDLLRRLVQIEGFLSFSKQSNTYRVNDNRQSGIFIDVKRTWNYPWIVSQIAQFMTDLSYGSDYIIGVETGGSPFAVKVATQLNLPFGLARKRSEFLKKAIAGLPDGIEAYSITIIDDVLGSGASLRRVLDNSANAAKEYRLVTLLSYGVDAKLETRYPNVKVRSVFQVENLIDCLEGTNKKIAQKALQVYQKKLDDLL